MRRQANILLFFALIFSVPLSGTDIPEMKRYEACVESLESSLALYYRLVPPLVFRGDRKLAHMADGISYLRENLETVKRQPGTADRHLVSNAVEGCDSYRETFEARAVKFLLLFACTGALALTLTLHIFLNILPAELGRFGVLSSREEGTQSFSRELKLSSDHGSLSLKNGTEPEQSRDESSSPSEKEARKWKRKKKSAKAASDEELASRREPESMHSGVASQRSRRSR